MNTVKSKPAFPAVTIIDGDNYNLPTKVYHPGMSLRDYFAAKAMQGELACQSDEYGAWSDLDALATRSYEIADAMLKARGGK